MTVVNPYARRKQNAASSTIMTPSASEGAMRSKPVAYEMPKKLSNLKGPPPRPPPLPLSKKSKENHLYQPSNGSKTSASSSVPLAVSGEGGAATVSVRQASLATKQVPTMPTLTLKRELAALKQQQKLQRERLNQQKEDKKHRKLLRKLQKKQQHEQAEQLARQQSPPDTDGYSSRNTTGSVGDNETFSSVSTTIEKPTLGETALMENVPSASVTSQQNSNSTGPQAAATDPFTFDDIFSAESNLHFSETRDDRNDDVVLNHPNKQQDFSTPLPDLWSNCEPIEYHPYPASTTSNATNLLPSQPLNYDPGYVQQYYSYQQEHTMQFPQAALPMDPISHHPWTTAMHYPASYAPTGPYPQMPYYYQQYPGADAYAWMHQSTMPMAPYYHHSQYQYQQQQQREQQIDHSLRAAKPTRAPPRAPKAVPSVETRKPDALKLESTDMTLKRAHATTKTNTLHDEVRQTMLSIYPMQATSPFAESHEILSEPIRLIREKAEEGYGIVLRLDSKTALVRDSGKGQKKRPSVYSVLSVLDPTIQNQRLHESHSGSLLQKDDILVSIHHHSTSGLTFATACDLFKQSDCFCEVRVARMKPVKVPSVPQQPLLVPPSATSLATGPLTPAEQFALVESVVRALYEDPRRRPLGCDLTTEWLSEVLTKSHPELVAARGSAALHLAWSEMTLQLYQALLRASNSKAGEMTDAQRSRLRMKPRLPNSCRCGSDSHLYVNDANCPLYSELRAFVDSTGHGKDDSSLDVGPSDDAVAIEEAAAKRKKLLDKNFQKDSLNAMEKAYKDRFVRMKSEHEAEEAEAAFVSRMESFQLSQRNQAIFAPSLAAMVLSAVAELEAEFKTEELSPLKYVSPIASTMNTTSRAEDTKSCTKESVTAKVEEQGVVSNLVEQEARTTLEKVQSPSTSSAKRDNGEESSDDEDDDVPLAALGKKRLNETTGEEKPITKKQRGNNAAVRPQFLARLIQFISAKWGHVFQEASHTDYSWRWEVYHGQQIDGVRCEAGNNLRSPESLSLENYRFFLSQQVIDDLEKDDFSIQKLEALKLLAFAASPLRTGILDELLAFVRTEILSIDDRGIPSLSGDWWSKVDFLLLDDMQGRFGVSADPNGKYGVAERIRKKLDQEWTTTPKGFAFGSDPEDVVYDFQEFDQWRMVFEQKQQAQSEGATGVHQFN